MRKQDLCYNDFINFVLMAFLQKLQEVEDNSVDNEHLQTGYDVPGTLIHLIPAITFIIL